MRFRKPRVGIQNIDVQKQGYQLDVINLLSGDGTNFHRPPNNRSLQQSL